MRSNIGDKASIYIHIPFCVKKCSYCDFYSIPEMSYIDKYIAALISEVNNSKSVDVDTIYLGGGTPSCLKIKDIARILDVFRNRFNVANDAEITMEINPGTCDPDCLKDFYSLGVNRLSIGVQSFNDDELKLLTRIHNSMQAEQCIMDARDAGFDNISIDIISSLPGQKINVYEETLKKSISFLPEHLSIYVLKIEPDTPMSDKFNKTEEDDLKFMQKTSEILLRNNYIHYEISNYAKEEQYVSRHNSNYWEYGNYLGFGPGAHSFYNGRRWANKKDVQSYIDGEFVDLEEVLTSDQILMEKKFLGLRTNKGVSLELFEDKDKAQELINKQLACFRDNMFVLTEQGFLVYDHICQEIC